MLFDDQEIFEIAASQADGLNDAVYGFLHMDEEQVLDMFEDEFEDTRANAIELLQGKAVLGSFGIEEATNGEVRLEGGVVLKSAVLAQLMEVADELVMYAAVVHGQNELMQTVEDEVIEGMLCEAWGAGLTMYANGWVKQLACDRAQEQGRYIGRSWVPGVNGLEMELQRQLFELLDLAQIGIQILDGHRLSPYLTISGFIGVSDDPKIEVAGVDLPEGH